MPWSRRFPASSTCFWCASSSGWYSPSWASRCSQENTTRWAGRRPKCCWHVWRNILKHTITIAKLARDTVLFFALAVGIYHTIWPTNSPPRLAKVRRPDHEEAGLCGDRAGRGGVPRREQHQVGEQPHHLRRRAKRIHLALPSRHLQRLARHHGRRHRLQKREEKLIPALNWRLRVFCRRIFPGFRLFMFHLFRPIFFLCFYFLWSNAGTG